MAKPGSITKNNKNMVMKYKKTLVILFHILHEIPSIAGPNQRLLKTFITSRVINQSISFVEFRFQLQIFIYFKLSLDFRKINS